MDRPLKALLLALIAPLMLTSCFLTPGKFVSTLFIGADRSFTFTYRGEVIAMDLSREIGSGDSDAPDPAPATLSRPSAQSGAAPKAGPAEPNNDAKFRAMAATLSQEPGYNRVEYRGEGVFEIDYALSGRLSHHFTFPFNADAEIVFPFVLVELRSGGMVRVKAPGFADEDSNASMAGEMARGKSKGPRPPSRLDGQFTLTTDAEIVSQNTERAPGSDASGRRSLSWRATPITRTAPMAVIRFAPGQ